MKMLMMVDPTDYIMINSLKDVHNFATYHLDLVNLINSLFGSFQSYVSYVMNKPIDAL